MNYKKQLKGARTALLVWCLFIGIGACAGATGMLSSPDGSALGMQGMLPYFQVLPFAEYLFQDFIFSGFALLTVNGLTNLTASVFIILKKKTGLILGTLFGITLMMWIIIQFIIFPLNFMSTIYFFFGLFQALTGYIAIVFYERNEFTFDESDYRNIGSNKKELVVYFSRNGFTKKLAYITANASGADVLEIKTTELTKGAKGFLWCGRFGMHKWGMNIQNDIRELDGYEKVTIVSPVWVFSLSAPMRQFCKEAKGHVRSADYIITHFSRGVFSNVFSEIDSLLGIKGGNRRSVVCRRGRYIKTF